jgi:hypothetical protein
MKSNNNLLIVEMSSSTLNVAASDNKDYVLEGIFGQIDQKNRNNRIYTEDEYLPQIEALQAKIKSSKLLGELDHPAHFDISLKNVSHVIEELYYDKDTKQVRGRIRLLDTDAGRQAKALVDAGVPLQISSRAAGAVESNGQVKIKQLFTYDLVADPGFENAELKRVNESYGFDTDNGLYIYEMGAANVTENFENTNTETKESKNMAEFVKAEDFNRYSEYLAKEIKAIKEAITESQATSESDDTIKNVVSHNDHIVENVNNLSEYVEYLAEKLDDAIQYTEHVAEKADQGIQYAEHVAEKLDNGISYTEHLAEAISKVKDFANYLAEAHNDGAESNENLVNYVNYLRENLQSVSEYAEYIAESINENIVIEEVEDEGAAKEYDESEDEDEIEKIGDNSEEGNVDDSAEDVAVDATEAEEEDLEEVGDNSKEGDVDADAEEIAADVLGADGEEPKEVANGEDDEVKDIADEVEDEIIDGEEGAKEVVEEEEAEVEIEVKGDVEVEVSHEDEEDEESEEAEGEEEVEESPEAEEAPEAPEAEGEEAEEAPEAEGEEEDALEAYKKSISAKLDALVEKATVKENENPSFFRVVSSTTREKYNALTEAAKTEVRTTVSKRGFMTEAEINSLMESAQLIVESAGRQPYFIEAMPSEYAETWNNLSESKKSQIVAQANYHTLKTEYQVANFWQTRDLRDTKIELEKVAMVNESKVEEKKSSLYDVTGYAEAFKKRFQN